MFKYVKRYGCFLIMITLLLSILSSCGGRVQSEPVTTTQSSSSTVRVTFPEGFCVVDIATRLEDNGVCSFDDFVAEANNQAYLEEFGIVVDNPENRAYLLEGYLFPDTYDFYIGENPSSVIKKFLRNTFAKLSDELISRATELGYSVDEILTLASIIQKEAGIESESSKVSSVIHNRLNSKEFSKLQCDCCSFYLRDKVKPYVDENRYEELLELYNTYRCDGIPEGPICNSGIDTINAALYPDDTDYYYFVTDSDGKYYYASDWSGHVENCTLAGIE